MTINVSHLSPRFRRRSGVVLVVNASISIVCCAYVLLFMVAYRKLRDQTHRFLAALTVYTALSVAFYASPVQHDHPPPDSFSCPVVAVWEFGFFALSGAILLIEYFSLRSLQDASPLETAEEIKWYLFPALLGLAIFSVTLPVCLKAGLQSRPFARFLDGELMVWLVITVWIGWMFARLNRSLHSRWAELENELTEEFARGNLTRAEKHTKHKLASLRARAIKDIVRPLRPFPFVFLVFAIAYSLRIVVDFVGDTFTAQMVTRWIYLFDSLRGIVMLVVYYRFTRADRESMAPLAVLRQLVRRRTKVLQFAEQAAVYSESLLEHGDVDSDSDGVDGGGSSFDDVRRRRLRSVYVAFEDTFDNEGDSGGEERGGLGGGPAGTRTGTTETML